MNASLSFDSDTHSRGASYPFILGHELVHRNPLLGSRTEIPQHHFTCFALVGPDDYGRLSLARRGYLELFGYRLCLESVFDTHPAVAECVAQTKYFRDIGGRDGDKKTSNLPPAYGAIE